MPPRPLAYSNGAVQREVHIVGGGLAGTEAALVLADQGVPVVLHEQKPERRSPAHKEDGLAELVCSNSLRSDNPHNAVGLLHDRPPNPLRDCLGGGTRGGTVGRDGRRLILLP